MMNRFLSLLLLAALLLAPFASTASAAITDDDVDRAIKKLQDNLLSSHEKGSWDHLYKNEHAGKSGVTAMVTYALVYSGVPVQHKTIQQAITHLRGTEGEWTYELGLRAHAWGQLPDVYKNEMEKESAILRTTGSFGVYSYKASKSMASPASGNASPPHDHSNTQYGILGMWEASKRGVKIDTAYWNHVKDHFIAAQGKDGGWNYSKSDDRPSYFNMTSAGLTAMLVAEQELYRGSPKREPKVADSINKGLVWMDKNFGGGDSWGLYGVYGLERVGLATGVKYFNNKDWFAMYADGIVKAVDGGGPAAIYDKCFALLFLSRGRVPVWCTKLKIPDAAWNNRPNDIYFFSKDLGEYIEGEVNFQTVGVNEADERWFNAPIAWISSDEKFELADDMKQRLKRFIDNGGMLIVNGETGSAGGNMFKAYMKKIFEEMYPYKFTRLDNNHLVFRVHHKIDNGSALGLTTMSNGAREMVVMPDRDWGMMFQTSKTDDQQFKLAVNLFVLATERGRLDNRLDVHVLRRKAGESKGEIKVVRAKYEGNWLPEPGVWATMDKHLFNQKEFSIKVEDVALDAIGTSDAPFVHLAGTDPVKLTDAQLNAIKTFVGKGGTILVETVGGRRLFSSNMEEQLTSLFQSGAAPLGRGSHIISGQGIAGGIDNRFVTYRRGAIIKLDVRHDPRLNAIISGGRPGVIISPEDLSLGVLGVRAEGVWGYSTDSSVKLLINMLLAANQKVGAPGAAPVAPPAAAPAPPAAAAPAPPAEPAADAKP